MYTLIYMYRKKLLLGAPIRMSCIVKGAWSPRAGVPPGRAQGRVACLTMRQSLSGGSCGRKRKNFKKKQKEYVKHHMAHYHAAFGINSKRTCPISNIVLLLRPYQSWIHNSRCDECSQSMRSCISAFTQATERFFTLFFLLGLCSFSFFSRGVR